LGTNSWAKTPNSITGLPPRRAIGDGRTIPGN
jgi:hypothetical protein